MAVAPARAWSEVSVTVPEMVPVTLCACAAVARSKAARREARLRQVLSKVAISFPSTDIPVLAPCRRPRRGVALGPS